MDERHIPSLMVGTDHKEEGIKAKWNYSNSNQWNNENQTKSSEKLY